MANKHDNLAGLFAGIADAIRAKTGGTDTIVADDFPDVIATDLGTKPSGTKSITANGNYGVAAYESVSVNVAGGGSSTRLQSKSVTPTTSDIIVEPDSGYDGLSNVTVTGDANLLKKNIAKGVTIFGVAGSNNVVNTAESASPITSDTVLNGYIGFVNGNKVTGSHTCPTATLAYGTTYTVFKETLSSGPSVPIQSDYKKIYTLTFPDAIRGTARVELTFNNNSTATINFKIYNATGSATGTSAGTKNITIPDDGKVEISAYANSGSSSTASLASVTVKVASGVCTGVRVF